MDKQPKLNEQRFRADMQAKGFSDKEINEAINRYKVKQSWYGKLASSGVIPWITGVPSFIAGTAIAGPAGATGFGAAGYAGGKALEGSLLNLAGRDLDKEGALQDVSDLAYESATFGLGAGALSSLLALASALAHPQKTLATQREKAISKLPEDKRNILRTELEQRLKEVSEKPFTFEQRRETSQRSSDFMNKLFPFKGTTSSNITQPEKIDLNELYRNLIQFEKELKPYDKSSLTAVAGKDISSTVRDIANMQGGTNVQRLNTLMSRLYQMEPYTRRAKQGVAGAVGAKVGWDILNKLGIPGRFLGD